MKSGLTCCSLPCRTPAAGAGGRLQAAGKGSGSGPRGVCLESERDWTLAHGTTEVGEKHGRKGRSAQGRLFSSRVGEAPHALLYSLNISSGTGLKIRGPGGGFNHPTPKI